MAFPPKAGILQSELTCSVCLELVNGTHERSIAKLICGHTFHLDCIGSAFNAKGSMQCPNCRRIEHGDWLYGNGRPHLENSMLDNMMLEDEYDVELEMLARVSEFGIPDDIWQSHWFPYQEMHTHLALSLGNENHSTTPYAEVVVGVLVGENLESTRSVQPSPYARAQAPVLDRRARGVEGNVGVPAASLARTRRGAAYQQHFSPSIEQRGRRQSPAAVEPNVVTGGVGVEEGSAGHIWPSQSRHDGPRRRSSASANQFLQRPESWRHASTTSGVQEAVRESQPRSIPNFIHRRRARQYPSEPEGQRWAPSLPFLGLRGTHGIPAPYVASSDHPVQAPSHARRLYPVTEDRDVHPSRSFYHPR